MSDFAIKDLSEFTTHLVCPTEERSVVIIGESIEAAEEQVQKFIQHLEEAENLIFTHSPLVKMEKFHVTYTPGAWEKLKEV